MKPCVTGGGWPGRLNTDITSQTAKPQRSPTADATFSLLCILFCAPFLLGRSKSGSPTVAWICVVSTRVDLMIGWSHLSVKLAKSTTNPYLGKASGLRREQRTTPKGFISTPNPNFIIISPAKEPQLEPGLCHAMLLSELGMRMRYSSLSFVGAREIIKNSDFLSFFLYSQSYEGGQISNKL